MRLNPQDVLIRLNPFAVPGTMVIWSIWLYFIMLLAIVAMARQKIPVLTVTLLLVGTLMIALIDKVGVGFPANNIFPKKGCGAAPLLILRIAMFIMPTLTVGLSKTEKARPLSIICAFLAFVYFWARGLAEMELLIGGSSLNCGGDTIYN
jgi:hypothetical protein